MKKLLKNRTAIGVGSILLALILSFGVTPLVNKAMRSEVEIIRATKNIKKGEEITTDKIRKVKVGGFNLPQNVIKNTDELIGKYVVTDIYKDDYFQSSKVSDTKGEDDNYLYEISRKENMAISITIKSLAAGLSSKLKPGDIVSILSSSEDNYVSTIIPELRYVEVLAVTTKEGKDIEGGKEEELCSTITLSVETTQAEKLIKQEQNGNIHIALVHRGDIERANEYLEIQKEYILSLEDLEIKQEGEINGESEEKTDTEIESTQNTDTEIGESKETQNNEDRNE